MARADGAGVMGYNYADQKPSLFTDDGQRMFLKIRDEAFRLTAIAGAARVQEIIRNASGDPWSMLACVDRLVEIGELIEITQEQVAGQHRVFFRPRHD